MMTPAAFQQWCRTLALAPATCDLLATIRARYQQVEGGSWRCPPAEACVEPLGLTFRVRSSAELHPTYIDNLSFLADYFGMSLAVPGPVQTYILQRVREIPGLPLIRPNGDGRKPQKRLWKRRSSLPRLSL